MSKTTKITIETEPKLNIPVIIYHLLYMANGMFILQAISDKSWFLSLGGLALLLVFIVNDERLYKKTNE